MGGPSPCRGRSPLHYFLLPASAGASAPVRQLAERGIVLKQDLGMPLALPLCCRAVADWQLPPAEAIPPGSTVVGNSAVQTPFANGEAVTLTFPEE